MTTGATGVIGSELRRPQHAPRGASADAAGALFLQPSACTRALLDGTGLPARLVVRRAYLAIEAGSRWAWDAALGALVDASGADRVLLAPIARLLLRQGWATAEGTL